jgi:hypothetical protein
MKMNSARGHLWDHVPAKYCQSCGGAGVREGFRWVWNHEKHRAELPAPEPCLPCNGTGRNPKREDRHARRRPQIDE